MMDNSESSDRAALVEEDHLQQEVSSNENEVTTLPGLPTPVVASGSSFVDPRAVSLDLPPPDKFNAVKLSFLLIGVATLMPWNIFITATDYWMYKFRNPNETHLDIPHRNKTELQTFFLSYLSISSNVPFLLMLMVNAFIGQRISQVYRTILGITAILFIFILTTIFINVDTDDFQYTFFHITLMSVVVMSCFSAVFQGAVVSQVSVFPSKCMHLYSLGQSVAGLFAVVAQILFLLGNFDPTQTAMYYFLSANSVLLLTLVVYITLPSSPYFMYFFQGNVQRDESSSMSQDGTNDLEGDVTPRLRDRANLWAAFKSMKYHALTVLITTFTTVAVFPPLCVLIVPEKPDSDFWTGRMFTPITSFLVYQLSDFTGRWITNSVPISVKSPFLLFALSIIRMALVPLLMVCNAHPRSHLPVLFHHEGYFIGLILVIGVTNGYLYVNAMINGPRYVEPNLRSKTGFILVLFLGFGVAIGSILSNLILRLL